jgi:hypothetical protein
MIKLGTFVPSPALYHDNKEVFKKNLRLAADYLPLSDRFEVYPIHRYFCSEF